MFQPTTRLTPPMLMSTPTPTPTPTSPSAPIPIKQRHRSSFSQTRKRRPSESTPRLAHAEDRDRLASSKLQATVSPLVTTTATFTTTPSGALALSLSPPGLNTGLSKSAPLENESLSSQSHRRKGTTFRCETCAKVYRHPSCLVKHRWEHSPHWHEASKFLLSKHQQVQLLEAAAILSHLSPATAGGTSLPEDRSLWPSYLSGGLLPLPVGRPISVTNATNLAPTSHSDAATQDSLYHVEPNSSVGSANAHILSGRGGSLTPGVKLEASPEVDIPVKSEDSTSEEDEEEEEEDVEIEDAEFDDEANFDIDVDVEGEAEETKGGIGMANVSLISAGRSASASSSKTRAMFALPTARARTTTPGLALSTSEASTPKPLPAPRTATIPARAGLTEIRPGLLGHPNPPPIQTPSPTPFSPPQSLANANSQTHSTVGTSSAPSHWTYGYSHPHAGSNGYAIISQSSVPSAIPPMHQHQQSSPQLGPFSMSAPLSASSPFSHLHLPNPTSYSSSHHHYAFSPSYSPIGSISGPFASLSLSYSNSVLEGDNKQTKGLGLPRSSVRSSSGSSDDDDEMMHDDNIPEGVAKGGKLASAESLATASLPGNNGEWEMEI